MISDSQPRPDDVCEIDGEAINDVSSNNEYQNNKFDIRSLLLVESFRDLRNQ